MWKSKNLIYNNKKWTSRHNRLFQRLPQDDQSTKLKDSIYSDSIYMVHSFSISCPYFKYVSGTFYVPQIEHHQTCTLHQM